VHLLKNNPCIKLLIIAAIGILFAKFGPCYKIIFYIISALFSLLLFDLFRLKSIDREIICSDILILILFYISYINAVSVKGEKHPVLNTSEEFTGEITEIPQEKDNSYKAILRIIDSETKSLTNQKVIAYFEKNDKFKKLEPGDFISGSSYFKKITNTGDPYGFNYREFLENKEIYYSTYLSSQKTTTQKIESGFGLMRMKKIRKNLILQLKQNIDNDMAFQIVSALTLGYRDELDSETRTYFTSAGVMHVLAVSGLHVGMILLFLNFALSFLKKFRPGKYIYSFLILSGVWGYAFITGFSPSVQRASFMFTFIIIAKNLHRSLSVYNSIAASAFFLLMFHPGLLFNIGFQLSYIAVISIVFFYPLLHKLFSSKNKLLKWGEDLLCISVAAQIGTFPISIYYFHQFPTYFWISNFVVIPAAYLILGTTFLFFLFSSFPWLVSSFSIILTFITKTTVYMLIQIEKLPVALIEGLYFSALQVLLLLCFLFFTMLFIKKNYQPAFFMCLILIFFIGTDGFIQKIKIINQKKVLIYSPERHMVQFINGRKNYIITDLEADPDKKIYKNGIAKLKLNSPVILHLKKEKDFFLYDFQKKGNYIQFTDHIFLLKEGKIPYNLYIKKKDGSFINMKTGIYNLKKHKNKDSILIKEQFL